MMTAERILRPEDVKTPGQLAKGLNELRGGLSSGDLERAAKRLNPPAELPDSTLTSLLNDGRTSERTLATFLNVCKVAPDEQKLWIAAWMRTRDKKTSIRVTAESNEIETAPEYGEAIDSWLARQKELMLEPDGPSGSPTVEIQRIVENACNLVGDVASLVRQLQPDPERNADPVAFGRLGAKAIGISIGRAMQLPLFAAKGAAPGAKKTTYEDEVEKYITDCRPALNLRARTLLARSPGCALRLRVTNPTDVDASGIVVRLTFPDDVETIEPALLKTPPFGLPPRPVRVDSTSPPSFTLRDVYDEDLGLVRQFTDDLLAEPASSDYTIIGAEPPRVEVSGIDVPSKESTLLPPIPLLVKGSEGVKLSFRWTATSSVHPLSSGGASVPTVTSTFSIDRLFPSS